MSEAHTFQDFLDAVDGENRVFVVELHEELTRLGCNAQVKQAKSGYVVSYIQNQRTIANYVFRKKGLVARIYTNHIAQYPGILDTLPEGMAQAVRKAPICKRLADPAACNQRCPMGYDFIMKGERLQRCRNGAFQFLLSGETRPFIKALVLREAEAGL